MKHDTEVRDTDSEQAAEGAKPAARPVNTSRRRFTRAGLSASAVMTLASRPALAMSCSQSGTASGNTSQPGTTTCLGLPSGFWKQNEFQWSTTTCVPGMCNATTVQNTQCLDYDFCTAGELEAAKSGMPLDRYNAYKTWANWNETTPA